MTITLTGKPPGGQNAVDCVLCAGDARNSTGQPMGPQNVRRTERPGAALREYVGADRVEGEWVKCDAGTLTFGVTRIFPSEAAAAAFALTGFGSEPRDGVLTATQDGQTVDLFTKCVVTGRESSQVGVAVYTQYTIEG